MSGKVATFFQIKSNEETIRGTKSAERFHYSYPRLNLVVPIPN